MLLDLPAPPSSSTTTTSALKAKAYKQALRLLGYKSKSTKVHHKSHHKAHSHRHAK